MMHNQPAMHRPTCIDQPRLRRAFTLVEVLVSLTISALLVVSIVSTTRTLTDARNAVGRRIGRLAEARHAMDTIVAALHNVRRDSHAGESVVVGEHDRIDLLVTSDQRVRREGAESDQYEVSFRLAEPPDRPRPVLMCRKDHAFDEHPDAGGVATVVAEGIVGLAFEYHTGTEWTDEWPDSKHRRPMAIRVRIAAVDVSSSRARRQPATTVLSTVSYVGGITDLGMVEKEDEGKRP